MKMNKCLAVAFCFVSGCASPEKFESDFSCSSSKQEFGDYNLEMNHFKVNDRNKSEFAIKLNKNIIKIYNVELDKMWLQDSIVFQQEKKGFYYFQSATPEHLDLLGVLELPTKYIVNKNNNTIFVLTMNKYEGEDKVRCGGSGFILNCQL